MEHELRLAWANGISDVRWLSAGRSRRPLLKFCPRCLDEKQVWSADWRLSDQPICRTHRVWLIDQCDKCGGSIQWSRTQLLRCVCQAELRDSRAPAVSGSMWRCVQLGTDVSALKWLGAWSTHGPLGKPLKRASATRVSQISRLLESGAEVATDWPRAWIATLTRHRAPSAAGQVQRLAEAWPGLPVQIRRLPDPVWRDRVWAAVDEFVGQSHNSARPVVGRNPRLRHRALTQKAAAERLGVGTARLQAVLAGVALIGTIPRGGVGGGTETGDVDEQESTARIPQRNTAAGRVRRVISLDLVASLASVLNARISLRAAAELLGCGRGRVGAIVSAGLLRAEAGKLLRSEVEALRDRLLAQGRRVGCVACSAAGWEPLNRTWRLRVPAPTTRKFLTAIDAGHIRVFAPVGAETWREVEVFTSDVRAWWTSVEAREAETVSLGVAAAALGIKDQVAHELVNRGLLSTVTLRIGRRSARRVPMCAISEFAARYVALSALTAAEGIHSCHALNWARSRGLKVISGPGVDGARQYFVEIELGGARTHENPG